MKLKLGPILYAESGATSDPNGDVWSFRAQMLVTEAEEEPPITIDSQADGVQVGDPSLTHSFPEYGEEGAYYWSWKVEAERREEGRWISYRVFSSGSQLSLPDWLADPVDRIYVPKQGGIPDFAFFSCNGVGEESLYHQLEKPQRLWEDIRRQHRESQEEEKPGYSLLIGGGDQLYADQLWQKPPLKEFEGMDGEKRLDKPTGNDFVPRLTEQFVDLYADRWTRRGTKQVLARVPGIFTWDDHDIVDGWGSYPEEKQNADCFQGLYEAASDCFEAFQLGGEENNCYGERDHYLQSLTYREPGHELDLIAIDIRSGRTRDQVMAESQWSDLKELLEKHARRDSDDRTRHLVLVSSIPVVFLQYRIGHLPINFGNLQDDLIDQWQHSRHRGERARLIMRLLRHAGRSGTRVTILSGDVHVGSRGRIVSDNPNHLPENGHSKDQAIIHQVTSSAIGHPPPDYWKWQGILVASDDEPENAGDQVRTEVLPVSSDNEYLRTRNWLSGRFDDPESKGLEGSDEDEKRQRLWLQWRYEASDTRSGGLTVEPVHEQVVVKAYSQ